MADVTTETTTDTVPTVTPSEPSGVLDLRPPKESVRILARLPAWRARDVRRCRHVRHFDGREDESRPHPHLGRIEGRDAYRYDDRRRLIQHSNFFNPCNPHGLRGFRI